MNPISVNAYYADQGAPQAFGKAAQLETKPCSAAFVSAYNAGAARVYIELYDVADVADISGKTPRVLPCDADSFVSWTQMRFKNGIYARAMNAASGGSAIAGDDVQFDSAHMVDMV